VRPAREARASAKAWAWGDKGHIAAHDSGQVAAGPGFVPDHHREGALAAARSAAERGTRPRPTPAAIRSTASAAHLDAHIQPAAGFRHVVHQPGVEAAAGVQHHEGLVEDFGDAHPGPRRHRMAGRVTSTMRSCR
jgi:hypothetical protein